MAFKRRIIYALGALSLFASCSSPVSSVTIKAKPTVYASLGQYSYPVSSYINPSKIESLMGNPTGLSVYNYQPTPTGSGTAPQEYLFHYPLLSVPLNVGSNMTNLNLASLINTKIPAQSFAIPAINQTMNIPATFDVNAVLRQAVNSGLTAQTATIGETGLSSPPPATVTIPLSISSFSTVTVATGALNLTFGAVSGASPGFTLTITQISLVAGGQTLSSTASSLNLLTGGTATLPFAASTTLTSSFNVALTVTTSGGTTGHQDTFTMQAALSNDFTISSASGVNFSTSIPVPATSFPFNPASNFVSATVAPSQGQMIITPGALPSSWTGFTQSTSVSISQPAGLNLNQNGSGPLTLDLSNQTISASTISLSGSTTVKAVNATISGLSGPVTLTSSAAITVGQFSSVVVTPGSSFVPSTTVNYNLQTNLSAQQFQMWQWVNWIDFTGLGFSLSFTNNLPAGNDMNMTINSQAFGLSQTQALTSNQTTTTSFLSGSTTTPYQYVPSHNYGAGAWVIDLAVTLQPKSWNAATGELTLYNISPGSTLNFSATLTPVTNWSQVNISPPASGFSGTYPTSGSVDLSGLTKYLGSNFTFPIIPAYVYLSGIDPTKISGMNATVTAEYTNAGVLTTTYLLGTSTSPSSITMLSLPPTFPPDGSTLTGYPQPVSATISDLSPPFNAKPTDLVLKYDLSMASITLTPSDLTSTSDTTLSVGIAVPFPLQFIIPASGASLNFNSGTSDFFGRTSPTSNTVDNLLGQLTSVTVALNLDNTTGLTGSAVFSDSSGFSKSLTLVTGLSTVQLQLTPADISHIINTIPFAPSLQVTLNTSGAAETVTLPANGISGTASVTAVADINQTYNF
ncbi:MAG: hypothetical protein HKM05_04155 [Spirochaetales bacterium]|nr:hypothetical protein [Spirochaetales bacterium]